MNVARAMQLPIRITNRFAKTPFMLCRIRLVASFTSRAVSGSRKNSSATDSPTGLNVSRVSARVALSTGRALEDVPRAHPGAPEGRFEMPFGFASIEGRTIAPLIDPALGLRRPNAQERARRPGLGVADELAGGPQDAPFEGDAQRDAEGHAAHHHALRCRAAETQGARAEFGREPVGSGGERFRARRRPPPARRRREVAPFSRLNARAS